MPQEDLFGEQQRGHQALQTGKLVKSLYLIKVETKVK